MLKQVRRRKKERKERQRVVCKHFCHRRLFLIALFPSSQSNRGGERGRAWRRCDNELGSAMATLTGGRGPSNADAKQPRCRTARWRRQVDAARTPPGIAHNFIVHPEQTETFALHLLRLCAPAAQLWMRSCAPTASCDAPFSLGLAHDMLENGFEGEAFCARP